jgi:tetratricopeptide (TPR) repeat protein
MGSDKDTLIVKEHLGKAYAKLKKIDKAIKYYSDNLDLYRDMKDTRGVARTLNKIGLIYLAKGNLDLALNYQLQCLEACKEAGDREGEAITLKNIGKIHSRLGNHVLSLKAHTASLNIKRKLGDRRGEALSLFHLGQSKIDAGDFENARMELEKAKTIFKNMGLKKELKRVEEELEELDALEEDMDLELEYGLKIGGDITGEDFLFK